MTSFLNYIIIFTECICYYSVINIYIARKTRPRLTDIIFCVLHVAIAGIFNSNIVLLFTLTQLIDLVYIFFINKKNITDTFIAHLLTFFSVILFQFIVVIITVILRIPTNIFAIQVMFNLLTLLIAIICNKLFKLNKLYLFLISAAMPVKILLTNTYLVGFSIILTFKLSNNAIYMNIPYFLAIFSIILAVNMFILYYEKSLSIKQTELEAYQKNIPIYETLINEIRASQHEYTNRIQALQQFASTCKDYESLSTSLTEYTNNSREVSISYPLLQINMPLLAAALYSLSEGANKKNINVRCNIQSTNLESMAPEYVLSDLTCTLMQNAIEACNAGDYIHADISSENGKFHFEIRNPIERLYTKEEIAIFFKKGYTTKSHLKKSDNIPHGYGLYSLHKNVEQYHGAVSCYCTELDGKYWITFQIEV